MSIKQITNLQNEIKKISEQHIYTLDKLIETQTRIEKINELLNRHDIDTGDIYYKYNNKFVKSELKERIREITGGDEE